MPDASFLVFLALVAFVAASGFFFRPGAWYAGLAKPGWTPPNWLFGPAWTILYLMIAFSGWLVWRVDGADAAVAIWGIQLVFNGLWSFLFFGRRRMDLAFADIGALWLAIAGFIVVAWPASQTAALLFVPYLAWVSFAAALNAGVWHLNPDAGSAGIEHGNRRPD